MTTGSEVRIVGGLDPGLPAAVTIATYDEAQNLPELLDKLCALDPRVGIVIIDDNSPDGTGNIADRVAGQRPGQVAVLHRAGKGGYASASKAGVKFAFDAGMPVILTMDADFSHDPAVVPKLVAAAKDADIVIGSRYVAGGGVENWPWHRILLSRMGGGFARLVTGMPVHDPTGGFRAYRREVLGTIGWWAVDVRGYSFLMESIFRAWVAGLKIVEVPIVFRDRTRGKSKLSKKIIVEALMVALRLGMTRRCPSRLRRYKEKMGETGG